MDKKKLGFFQKIILAVTDFRFYPYILKTESAARSFGHFLAFLILLTIIIAAKTMSLMYEKFDIFIEQYDKLVPNFKIEKGILDVEHNEMIEIRNDMIAIVDTSFKYEECIETSQYQTALKYDNILLINSDAISLIDKYDELYQINLSFIGETYSKETFKAHAISLSENIQVKLMIFGMLIFTIFIGYALYKFVEVLFFGILGVLISALGGVKINFKALLKIIMYALTLPYIVETISILYVGTIKEYAILASGFLAYVYIFYAIRAVKLDMLLMIMANDKKGNFKLKINTDGKYEIEKIETEGDKIVETEIKENNQDDEQKEESQQENKKQNDDDKGDENR